MRTLSTALLLASFMFPIESWALSQRPLFSKKDGKTNLFVVDVAAVCLEKGKPVEKSWVDRNLYNAVSTLHENGVVELRFPNGLRSWSVAGKEPKTRFKQAGAIFPKRGWIKEDVNGTPIYHIQTEPPILEKIKSKIHKLRPVNYDWIEQPDLGQLNQMDQFLLDMILSGDPKDLAYMLKEYPHKVTQESPRGRTIYLRLDNSIDGNITALRCKGVMPKRNILGRLSTYITSDREIKMVGGVPTIIKTLNLITPVGTMLLDAAKNEYAASLHFGGDDALGIGEYNIRHRNKKSGFIIYGMTGDDYRIMCAGRKNFWRNNVTNEIMELGSEGPEFYRSVGRMLRGAHSMGLIHRGFHLGNIGFTMSGPHKVPIFKDLEDSFRLELSASPYERAGWMFNDVAWPLSQWSRAMEPGIDVENYARQFLDGYLGGYVNKEIIEECITPLFARKMDQMQYHPIDIPEEFPHLYKAILSKEVLDSTIMDPVGVIEHGISVLIQTQQNN